MPGCHNIQDIANPAHFTLNLVGPFQTTDTMRGYALRDEEARDSDEWQKVCYNPVNKPKQIDREKVEAAWDEGVKWTDKSVDVQTLIEKQDDL